MAGKETTQRSPSTNSLMERLRDDIILGKYAPGEKIGEIQLTQKYGTSRTVVRGVLTLLEKEGLIQTQPNGTRKVNGLVQKDIENLYALRMILEKTAVKELELEGNDLLPILQSVQSIASEFSENACDLLNIDMRFHRSVIEASRNRALLQAWDAIAGVIHAVCRLNLTESQEYNKWYIQTFRERHMELFVTLMNDRDRVSSLFGEHIADAQAVSYRAFEKVSLQKGEEP